MTNLCYFQAAKIREAWKVKLKITKEIEYLFGGELNTGEIAYFAEQYQLAVCEQNNYSSAEMHNDYAVLIIIDNSPDNNLTYIGYPFNERQKA